MPHQCVSMNGQPIYGCSAVVPILSSPRCLCYCHAQGSTVFLYAVYLVFFGPSSLLYSMPFSKECYLWVSAVIHSHNVAQVSQVLLLYPVVYFFL